MLETRMEWAFLAFLPARDMAVAFVTGLHYFVCVFNGSDLLVVTRRDMNATWRTTGALCRELDWSKRRLIHEMCNRLRYRTIPEGYVIEWDNDFLWPYLNVEASEISVPYGLYAAGVVPPPPKTRAGLDRGLTLGIEVLPPTGA